MNRSLYKYLIQLLKIKLWITNEEVKPNKPDKILILNNLSVNN